MQLDKPSGDRFYPQVSDRLKQASENQNYFGIEHLLNYTNLSTK